ncbi:MAG: hypothetical protein MJ188_09615 [Treponema sp.]|nr:hypothetical protein [Treponema sp.]
MKKLFFCGFCLALAVSIISCKKNNSEKKESKMEVQQTSNPIDLDLSVMSYTMFSSIVFDVMVTPEKYANKRIKVSGNYYSSVYDGQRYFSVLNWDATGCCPAGFDFIPLPAMHFPEDFPQDDEKIIVTGTLKYADEAKNALLFYAEEIKIVE